MSPTKFVRKSLARRLTQILLSAALTAAVGGYTEQAHAQWLVEDVTAVTNAASEYGLQAGRWADTVKQYSDTIAHYQSEVAYWQSVYSKLSTFNLQLFAATNQFKRIPDDYGVADDCPGVTGGLAGDITSALSSFLPNMGGDVIKQQTQLCQMIAMTKNRKYNTSVDYLLYVASQSQDLLDIQKQRITEVGSSPGNLASNEAEVTRYGTNLATAREHWESDMKQSDLQIEMLMKMQSTLSRRAMNGQPSALGTLVNVAALKAAFTTK
jgi:hypothetical protein